MSTSTSSTNNNETVGIKYPLFVQALTFSPTSSQTIYFGNIPRVPTASLNRSKVFPEETISISCNGWKPLCKIIQSKL